MSRSTGKRITGVLLFIIAAIAVAAFLFLLFADSEGFDSVPGTDQVPEAALIAAIGLGVIALIIIILLLVRSYDRKDEASSNAEAFFIPGERSDDWVEFDEEAEDVVPVPSMAKDDGKLDRREGVVPHDLANVPLGAGAWGPTASDKGALVHSFHYPREEGKALYNNDYITINAKGEKLKLRTLLAAPEGIFDGKTDDPIKKAKAARTAPTPRKKATVEEKFALRAKKPKAKAPSYYDYTGDIHDVIDVEGIGPVYAQKLNAMGIMSTARLCYESPAKIAAKIGAHEKSVVSWQQMAELMKVTGIGPQYAEALVRSGITGIGELKQRNAAEMSAQINTYLDSLEVTVIKQSVTPRRVEGWQKAAKPMRKVRLPIPEE